ncbi:MAG: hypothetical protein L0Z53_19365, partial [Acidobacteriales bacterium]|nr:hypothetical protein [Terriglobales bacterium]
MKFQKRLWPAGINFVVLMVAACPGQGAPASQAELVSVKMIWKEAPHNAFTDLTRFQDKWFCVFREGKGHVSPDGAMRVLVSKDGEQWTSAARLTSTNADLRDPKITLTPDRQLMLTGAGAMHPPSSANHLSFVWFSADGTNWSEPVTIGDPNMWLWRTTWHKGAAYSVGYDTGGEKFARLYHSADG